MALLANIVPIHAYSAGETVNVKLTALLNGQEINISEVTATTNIDNKMNYNFTGVSVPADSEFLLIRINNDERIAVIPNPGDNQSIDTAATPFTKKLAISLLSQDEISPLSYAFTSLIIRSPQVSDLEAAAIATGVKTVVSTHENSMLNTMEDIVGKAKVAAFQEAMLNNETLNLKEYTSLLKDSVEAETSANTKIIANNAANKLADIIMTSLVSADIPLETFLSVFDKVSDIADGAFSSLSEETMSAMDVSIRSFNLRLKSVLMSKRYTTSLSAVGASQTMITRAQTAITTLTSDIQIIENQFSDSMYDHEIMSDDEKRVIWNAFDEAFASFESNMAAEDSENMSLKEDMAEAMDISLEDFSFLVGPGFGVRYNYDGSTSNIPINEAAAMSFVAELMINDTNLTYTRDTLIIPSQVSEWMPERTDFTSVMSQAPTSIQSLFGLREDIQIIEMTRWSEHEGENISNSQVEENFMNNIQNLVASIGNITTAQKKGLINLMLHPEL